MPARHPLHSPNLTEAELRAYFQTPLPLRHRHSLIELDKHDTLLVRYLIKPIDSRLFHELLRTVESVIRIPNVSGALPTPPVTPIKSLAQHQQQTQKRSHPPATQLNSEWRPLPEFMVDIIRNSKARVTTLWEITLMEKQLLGIIDFDLRITEKDLIDRLTPLIHPKSVSPASKLAVPVMPITPITPITPSNAAGPRSVTDAPVLPPRRMVEVKTREFVLQPVPAFKKRSEKATSQEKAPKGESESMSLSSSQSAPSDLSARPAKKVIPVVEIEAPAEDRLVLPVIRVHPKTSLSVPLCRSISSDGLLEGSGSSSLLSARTFSSTVSASMTTSSSISASTSTSNSEVATPADESSQYFDQSFKSHQIQSRPSETALESSSSVQIFHGDIPSGGSRLMSKLLGVGKSLSPTRRVGHGIKGERKVSTATIVPERVQDDH
ncbi:hypothetical protein FRC17_000055 [Serendipita sp. 399]|nr:hypothetical protein FRC17_000055 [Serendipita sp. 399]